MITLQLRQSERKDMQQSIVQLCIQCSATSQYNMQLKSESFPRFMAVLHSSSVLGDVIAILN